MCFFSFNFSEYAKKMCNCYHTSGTMAKEQLLCRIFNKGQKTKYMLFTTTDKLKVHLKFNMFFVFFVCLTYFLTSIFAWGVYIYLRIYKLNMCVFDGWFEEVNPLLLSGGWCRNHKQMNGQQIVLFLCLLLLWAVAESKRQESRACR